MSESPQFHPPSADGQCEYGKGTAVLPCSGTTNTVSDGFPWVHTPTIDSMTARQRQASHTAQGLGAIYAADDHICSRAHPPTVNNMTVVQGTRGWLAMPN